MIKRVVLSFAICVGSSATAEDMCDRLGALEADSHAVSESVAFSGIDGKALISSCTEAINAAETEEPRFFLQRGRGYLRTGQSQLAMADIRKAHELGYAAGTFSLATAHYLGDDLPQDYGLAEKLFLNSYYRGIRWSAKGLAMLYDNPSFADHDPMVAKLWLDRFNYHVPNGLTASRQEIDLVLDYYQGKCDEIAERTSETDSFGINRNLVTQYSNFTEITVDYGKPATLVYAAFGCGDFGYPWASAGGNNYYLIVDNDIFQGWGGKPYSIKFDGLFHIILPMSEASCETSDSMLYPSKNTCNGIANWDRVSQAFTSIGNLLPIWKP